MVEQACESKNERFRRLAESRGNRLIKEIQILGNLANRKNYDYSAEEVELLLGPVENALDQVRKKFETGNGAVDGVNFGDQ